jgi:hypothetical protein
VYIAVDHNGSGDWQTVPLTLMAANPEFVTLTKPVDYDLEGAPLLDKEGNMLGMIIKKEADKSFNQDLAMALKSDQILRLLDEWMQDIELSRSWRKEKKGTSPWIWAVGVGVAGGTIAFLAAASQPKSEMTQKKAGLPLPPVPPEQK